MASLRLLTKGAQDPETIASYQKALEMAEWSNRLQTVCAAQNALAAAGQKVKVLSDCKKSTDKEEAADKEKGKFKFDFYLSVTNNFVTDIVKQPRHKIPEK